MPHALQLPRPVIDRSCLFRDAANLVEVLGSSLRHGPGERPDTTLTLKHWSNYNISPSADTLIFALAEE